MTRAIAVVALLALACDRKQTSVASETPSTRPAPSASVAPEPASQVPTKAAPGPAKADAPEKEREQAVLALLGGKSSAEALPVMATDPGKTLDPALRNELAPAIRPPRIRVRKPTVKGDLPPEVVQRIVRQRFAMLRRCFEAEGEPELSGEVVIRFVIQKNGKVESAALAKNETGKKSLGDCMLSTFRGLTFPNPASGAAVSVTFPVIFNPK